MKHLQARMTRFFSTLWPAEQKTLVFGEGKTDHPPVMLIGEAPGEQETLQGRPFVGKAGKNLDGFLEAVDLRREDIYISNVVKVRPTKVSAKGSVSNRPPNREELLLFTPYLLEEILLVQPGVIVTLGNVALRALMGQQAAIGAMHGQAARTTVCHEKQSMDVPVFPLYHPASVIYDRSLAAVYQADLKALRAWLDGGCVI
ncbi:MAG: uracil-DNA glycosylase [Christensenellaceae bacterium]|nr:uracil-DNA glycosylase [Christensenellaceae bacterium]